MKREELRKVLFSFAPEDGYQDGLSEEKEKEVAEGCRQREGFFHCWTNVESANGIAEKMALIEDAETGEMQKIDVELITFKD